MSFLRNALYASTLFISTQAALADTTLDQTSQKDLALTIYQNGLGFVKDLRTAPLAVGPQTLAFEDISSQLIPDSLLISGEGFIVEQRRFAFDLLNPGILLEKSVGQDVTFRRLNPVTGKDELIKAKILSTQGGLVIERDGKIETGQPGSLVLESLPEGLRPRPALMADVNSSTAQDTDLLVAYLTNGIKWHGSYSVKINQDSTSVSLKSWANLTNTSGADYKNVDVSVAAGRVNRQSGGRPVPMMTKAAPRAMAMAMDSAVESTAAAPSSVGGIHLYKLPTRVDLNNRETKQVALMKPLTFDAKRVLVKSFGPSYGHRAGQVAQPVRPDIELSFKNTSDLPLPSGTARLYREDEKGEMQFVGEDRLKQTPKGNTVKLRPGQSFDVTMTRTQTEFQQDGKYRFEAAYKVVIKNAKDKPETVRVTENFQGEWELIKTSVQPKEKLARNANWEFEVPANGEKILTYRVGVRTR